MTRELRTFLTFQEGDCRGKPAAYGGPRIAPIGHYVRVGTALTVVVLVIIWTVAFWLAERRRRRWKSEGEPRLIRRVLEDRRAGPTVDDVGDG